MNTTKEQSEKSRLCSTSNTITAFAVLIAIAAVFFAGAMWAKSKTMPAPVAVAPPANNPAPPEPTISPDIKLLGVRGNDAVRGSGDILLIEYSDYECPFCQRFHATAQELVDSGEVAWVYRHLPLPFHQTAEDGATIGECVRAHVGANAFWSYTDGVFAAAELNLEKYKALAKGEGLSEAQITACLATGSEARKTVEQHKDDAQKMGVHGTPGSFLVNKKTKEIRTIPGAFPVTEVRKTLAEIQ